VGYFEVIDQSDWEKAGQILARPQFATLQSVEIGIEERPDYLNDEMAQRWRDKITGGMSSLHSRAYRYKGLAPAYVN
jgi:hypothetical protein